MVQLGSMNGTCNNSGLDHFVCRLNEGNVEKVTEKKSYGMEMKPQTWESVRLKVPTKH